MGNCKSGLGSRRLARIFEISGTVCFCLLALAFAQLDYASGPKPEAKAAAAVPSGAAQRDPAVQRKVLADYGKVPLSFEANQGQTDPSVKFLSRGSGYTLFLTGNEAVLALKKSEARSQNSEAEGVRDQGLRVADSTADNRNARIENRSRGLSLVPRHLPLATDYGRRTTNNGPRTRDVLTMRLAGANPKPTVSSDDELPGKSNYFIGNDPKKWRTNVPTYAKVRYENVYPGIDLVYYGNQGQLEYDFVVAPGADPHAIVLDVVAGLVPAQNGPSQAHRRGHPQGVPLRIDSNGDLVIELDGGALRFHRPVVYQASRAPSPESRAPVTGRYKLIGHNRVSFELGPYDHTRPLVIDPTLTYSTYLGGSAADQGNGIAVDSSGNAYIVGSTSSTNFPITTGGFQTSSPGGGDAFITKLNPQGSAAIYSTYLGGSSYDVAQAIASDAAGDAYITGYTDSTDFPVTAGAFQRTYAGGQDAFVTELNSSGSALIYSTYLGGSSGDTGRGIAINGSGNAYVTGETTSVNFPKHGRRLSKRLRWEFLR